MAGERMNNANFEISDGRMTRRFDCDGQST
jgi:hypothetical protein